MQLIFACLTRSLEELKGWPRSVFTRVPEGFEPVASRPELELSRDIRVGDGLDETHLGHGLGWQPSFVSKGLVFDFDTGDLLKLAADGRIVGGMHGLTRLSLERIAETYGGLTGAARWTDWKFELLRTQARHESFFVLITYFDIPCQLSLCQGVAWVDEGRVPDPPSPPLVHGGEAAVFLAHCANPHEPPARDASRPPPRYSSLWADHNACFNHMFDNVCGMETGRGGFFPALRASPGRYLAPRPHLAAWFKATRARGVRVFLVTNSHVRYARFTLGATLGAEWRDCFDLTLYNALKPAWFTKLMPWRAVDEEGLKGTPVTPPDAACPVGEGEPMTRIVISLTPAHLTQGEGGVRHDDGALPPALPCAEAFQGSGAALQVLADADVTVRRAGGGCVSPSALTLHVESSGHVQGCTLRRARAGGGKGCGGEEEEEAAVHVLRKDAAAAAAHGAVRDAPHPAPVPPSPSSSPLAPVTAGLTDALEDVADADTGSAIDDAGTRAEEEEEGRAPGLGSPSPGSVSIPSPPRARVLYVGDHLHGDVVAASSGHGRHGHAHGHGPGWDAVAVVEEGEALEGYEERAGQWRNWPAGGPGKDPLWGDFFTANMKGQAGTAPSYFASIIATYAVGAVTDVAHMEGVGTLQ